VLVVREGGIAGELGEAEMTEEAVIRLASGVGQHGEPQKIKAAEHVA
jgi:ribose transport system ATP-binding protein